MTKRVFTQEQDQEVARLYLSGLSSIKLAEHYEVDKSSILGALKRQGVNRRDNRAVSNEEELRLCGMYQAGLTITEISQKTGLSFRVVAAALKRQGAKKTDDRYTFTFEQEREIVEAYQVGQSMSEIGQRYGAMIKTVKDALERNGVVIRDGRMFTDEQEAEIASLYLGGLSAQQVADTLEVSRAVIENALERQQVERRPRRTNFFNEGAFDDLSSELPLYWIGFLYADSNVSDNELRVGLSIKDLSHLEKLRDFMNSDAKITTREGRAYGKYTQSGSCHTGFASKYLVNKLRLLGFAVKRGQFTKLKPHIPDNLAHHFIRGYLDGDGCISTNQQVVFLGQPDILEWIKDTLHSQVEASLNNKIRQRRGICEVSWGGINQARRIVDYLYRDATIYLERKREVADNWK